MEELKREYETIAYDGEQVTVEIPRQEILRRLKQAQKSQEKEAKRQAREEVALKPRILRALKEHPDGLNKSQVYLHVGCYPSGGSLALAQLEQAGKLSFEQRSGVGKAIICRLTEDTNV